MNSTQNEDELYQFMQDVVYEYGRGASHSKHTSREYGVESFNTEAFCRERATQLQALIAKAERARMVGLRDQWGVWLDDSADDKQTIREIYDWLNREIDFFDKERHTPEDPEAGK